MIKCMHTYCNYPFIAKQCTHVKGDCHLHLAQLMMRNLHISLSEEGSVISAHVSHLSANTQVFIQKDFGLTRLVTSAR